MSLAPGSRLGPYEIVAPLGSGGMGEVYRARDSRLGRTVAIKILPPSVAADPDRRARFEREARAISALSHPRVCALYDVGRERDVDFLVMEYLDGETLATRLERGPLAFVEALDYAAHIAAGLHEAHRLGIVHRDLKPGNVMLTRVGARLLDFGIARLQGPLSPAAPHDASTQMLTAEHTIVGTVAYASPEQIAGREVDARSDIFSFGVLLFQMVTGRLPFEAQTTAGVMAAIAEVEAPLLTAHAPGAPRALERLIQHCLAKDPEQRWQSARDLELQLTAIRTGLDDASPRAAGTAWRALPWVIPAGMLLLAIGALAGAAIARRTLSAPAGPAPRVVQFTIPLAPGESIHEHSSSSLALSPDGRRIAYSVNRADARGLYVRALDSPKATWLSGAEGATSPFFSPDGQWIAFESGGSLKKVHADGGTAVRLCDTPYFAGGSWSGSRIVFVPSFTTGLFDIAADGGRPRRLTAPDVTRGEHAHLWPQVLPDGRVLFTIWTGGKSDESRLAILSPSTGTYTVVLESGFHGRYSSGRLVFARGSRLFAQPFDLERAAVSGPAEAIVDGVAGDAGNVAALFTVGADATVVYAPGRQRSMPRGLVAVRPGGAREAITSTPRAYVLGRLSPDARRIAVWIEDAAASVWIKDLARDPLTRVSFSNDDHGPVWSPDGRRIAFESGRAGAHQLFVRAADGSGDDRQITTGEHHHYLNDWSPDGRWLLYNEYHPETGADLWMVNVDGPPQPRAYRATPFAEKQAAYSPDGRWIAYVADDSNVNEVYVQSASGPQRTQISSGGGDEPAWSRSGDRLFYREGSRMLAVPVTAAGGVLTAGRPSVLFEGLFDYSLTPTRAYDVTPDGRFIMVSLPDPASSPREVNVILNRFR